MPGSHLNLPAFKAVALSTAPLLCPDLKIRYLHRAMAQEIEFPPHPQFSDLAIHSNTAISKNIYSCRSDTAFRCQLEKAGGTSWAVHFAEGLVSGGSSSSFRAGRNLPRMPYRLSKHLCWRKQTPQGGVMEGHSP